ncbi:hypothetical protein HZA42_00680 [Candidatus Peregrinibacteria bacterium]|nr:hypothetical protein [Candidatus Peregrinibacteria bacterium]
MENGQAVIPKQSTAQHGNIAAISAAVLAAVSAAGCSEQKVENDDFPPQIAQSEYALALKDLNPPAAPVVLPIVNGRSARISQIGHSTPSHMGPATARAIDLAVDGDFAAPISGVVTLNPGNCRQNADRANRLSCNDGCNGGWGNLLGLEGLDGRKFIGAHCDSFAPGLQTGAFVLQGTPLCEIGCTGNSSGVHSHFDKTASTQPPITSQGIDYFITAVTGRSPSAERPGTANKAGTFVTCCQGGCAEYGATPADCQHSYVSFNQPLEETLVSKVAQMQLTDLRIKQTLGGIEPVRSGSNAMWTLAQQRIKYATILRGEVPAKILFYTGSFSGNGNRNPFITTGWSRIMEDSGSVLKNWAAYTQVHSEDFIKFDLYELMMAHVMPESRDAVAVPARIETFSNWSPDWELYRAVMAINGIDFHAYLAVLKRERGMRYGTYYNARDRIWTPDGWTGL